MDYIYAVVGGALFGWLMADWDFLPMAVGAIAVTLVYGFLFRKKRAKP